MMLLSKNKYDDDDEDGRARVTRDPVKTDAGASLLSSARA